MAPEDDLFFCVIWRIAFLYTILALLYLINMITLKSMIQVKFMAGSLLALPQPSEHPLITASVMIYCSVLFLVLKTLKHNKDRLGND